MLEVWDGDKKVDNFVACAICKNVLRYDSKSLGTNHLRLHLKRHQSQPNTMNQYLNKIEKSVKVSENHKFQLKEACVLYVSRDIRPFSSLEGEGFLNLIKTVARLGSIYGAQIADDMESILPSGQTISRSISAMAVQCKENLKLILRSYIVETNMIAMTVDVWQDKYKRISYLGMTAHFYEQKIGEIETHLSERIISMKPIECGISKDYTVIRLKIMECLRDLEIDDLFSKIVFVTDRGGNIRKALEQVERLNCFAHFINNIVKMTCQIDIVKVLIDKCRSLVKYFKITGLNNLLPSALKSGCETRFNYVHLMLDSIVKNWDNIDNVLRAQNEMRRIDGINYADLICISEYLKEYKVWSDHAAGSKRPTLYVVWIGIHSLMEHSFIDEDDHPLVSLMKVRAFTYIQEKFVLSPMHRIATFLHPGYKALRFASIDLIRETHEDTRSELERAYTIGRICSLIRRNSNSSDSSESSLTSYLDDNRETDEVVDYLQYRIVGTIGMDIVDWWIRRKAEFPRLSRLALALHSIPASSIPSERLFSKSGNLISEKRSCLSSATVENTLILHQSAIEKSKIIFDR